MTGSVAVSVLVPVLNEGRYVRAVTDAMRAQRFDEPIEFLMLDGGSSDSTAAELARLAESDPRFRVVRRQGLNIAQRLNLGLGMARGELIARMDAHTLFPPNYLAAGVARLRRGDVASVSGPSIASGEGRWSRRVSLALRSRLGRGGAEFRHVSPHEIELDSGFCGIWRRSLLVEHGGWNEHARMQDIELAARVRRAGGRIVCLPEMAARYLPRDSLPALARQYWGYGYHRAGVARCHPEMLRRSHLLPPAVVLATALAPARPAPRAALTVYLAALAAESARVGSRQPAADVVALPAVFATMHLSWGSGFLAACLRYGPPWPAIARGLMVDRAATGG